MYPFDDYAAAESFGYGYGQGGGESPLLALAQLQDPVYRSRLPSFTPGFRIPGVSQQHTLLAQMVLEPIVRSFLPTGAEAFGPGRILSTQNLFSQAQVRREYGELNHALSLGIELDRARWRRALEGQARILGTRFNGAAADQLTADFANVIGTPLARFAPGAYDAINGGRSGAAFAREMFLGSRFALDPNSGLPRLSPLALEATISNSYEAFYGQNADPRAARGLTSYQLGGLYHQFMTQHLGPRALGRDELLRQSFAEQRDALGPIAGQLAETLERASAAAGGPAAARLETRVRQFDAQRTQRFLREIAQAFTGLQDILTDEGHPNASPDQLFGLMNTLTQGQMHRLGPAGMRDFVRTLNGIRETTGQPVEQVARAIMAARRHTDALGLDPDAATRAGTFGFVQAEAAARLFGGQGIMGQGQLQHVMLSRYAAAETSAASLQMAATVRLAEQFREQVGADTPGGRSVRALATAIRNGQAEFVDPATGRRQSTAFQNESEWVAFMARAGIDPRTIQAQRGDIRTLQLEAGRLRTGAIAFGMQRDTDLLPQVQNIFRHELQQRLGGTLTSTQLNALAERAARGAFGAEGIDPTRTTDPRALRDFVQRSLPPGVALNEDQLRRLTESLSAGVSTVGTSIAEPVFGTSAREFFERYSIQAENAGRRAQALTRFSGLLHEAVSGINRSTFVGRLLDTVSRGGRDSDVRTAVGNLLNLVPDRRLREALGPVTNDLRRLRSEYEAAAGSGDHAGAGRILEEIRRQRDRLVAMLPEVTDERLGEAARTREEEARVAADRPHSFGLPGITSGDAGLGGAASRALDMLRSGVLEANRGRAAERDRLRNRILEITNRGDAATPDELVERGMLEVELESGEHEHLPTPPSARDLRSATPEAGGGAGGTLTLRGSVSITSDGRIEFTDVTGVTGPGTGRGGH